MAQTEKVESGKNGEKNPAKQMAGEKATKKSAPSSGSGGQPGYASTPYQDEPYPTEPPEAVHSKSDENSSEKRGLHWGKKPVSETNETKDGTASPRK